MILGYAVGGKVTDTFGYFTIFTIVQSLYALSNILVLLVPETLPQSHVRKELSWRDTNIVSAGRLMFRNLTIFTHCINFFTSITGKFGVYTAAVLYTRHKFNWTDTEVSYFFAADAFVRSLSVFVTIPLITYFIPKHTYWHRDNTWIWVSVL